MAVNPPPLSVSITLPHGQEWPWTLMRRCFALPWQSRNHCDHVCRSSWGSWRISSKRSEATKQVPHKHFSTHGLPASSNLSSCIVTWSPLYLLFSSSLYHLNYFLYITGLNAYFSVLWVRTSFHLGWKWGVFCTASALANAPARLLRGMGGPHGERKSQAAASWLSCSGSFCAFLLNSAS